MFKEFVKNEIDINTLFSEYKSGFVSINRITSEELFDNLKISIFSNKLKEEFVIPIYKKKSSFFKINLFFSLDDDLVIKKNKDIKLNIFYRLYEGVKKNPIRRIKKIKKVKENKIVLQKEEVNQKEVIEKKVRLSKIDWFIQKNQDLIENKNSKNENEKKMNGHGNNKGIFRALLNSKKDLLEVTENKNLFSYFKEYNYHETKKRKKKFMK